MSILKLARPEIVAMKPYSSARKEGPASGVLLNANESPWPLLDTGDQALALNRYPEPQPGELLAALANLYSLPEDHVLITRGSDEGIDLLTRVIPADNILFASEMVGAVRGIDPETGHNYDDTKRYIEAASVSPEQRRQIYEGNARRVFPRLDTALKAKGK